MIFSRDELKQYHMADEIKNINKKTKIRFFIGDVRDRDRLKLAFHDRFRNSCCSFKANTCC